MGDGDLPEHPPVVAVVGPTAVGKSDLGVELALRLGGEVVNADSMQLYRGMDIGTAKLTPDEQRGVAHHLLDVWEVTEEANVAAYQMLARRIVIDLRARGITPVLVGGSGLYVAAVLDDLDFPGTDATVRTRWEAALAEKGPAALHARLSSLDPAAAAGILPTNGRRIVRALEVVELRGSYTSSLPTAPAALGGRVVRVGLTAPRDVLDQRVETRVGRMWDAGLVDEVRTLRGEGLRAESTAGRALGYRQVLAHLDGLLTEEQARQETVARTRRFVRRQESWFRRDQGIEWFETDESDLVELVLSRASLGPTASPAG